MTDEQDRLAPAGCCGYGGPPDDDDDYTETCCVPHPTEPARPCAVAVAAAVVNEHTKNWFSTDRGGTCAKGSRACRKIRTGTGTRRELTVGADEDVLLVARGGLRWIRDNGRPRLQACVFTDLLHTRVAVDPSPTLPLIP